MKLIYSQRLSALVDYAADAGVELPEIGELSSCSEGYNTDGSLVVEIFENGFSFAMLITARIASGEVGLQPFYGKDEGGAYHFFAGRSEAEVVEKVTKALDEVQK